MYYTYAMAMKSEG